MAIPGNFLSTTTEMVDPNTSGWAPLVNCTISLGSGGRAGDGVLTVKSVAAGEMRARTFSSYQVVPGELYFTFADASSSTQAERIGVRWLNATGAEISITWSMTTASASSSWHRVSVAGVAPVGAARAQVVLSSTVSGAAVTHFWENVYLGWPLRYPGNLLSFNAESGGELDLSAWAAETNCALSRTVPVTTWAIDNYFQGGHQIALTVTSSGNASALCTERPPVTPGVEYLAFAYLNPPTSGSSVWVELRFYDAAGAQLAAHRSTMAPPGTGWYKQIASGVAPAGAASAGIAVGITSGTAAQVVRVDSTYIAPLDVAALGTLRTGNVLPMADWDFEMGVGGWTKSSGVATIARSTPWGASASYDAYALAVSSSTATASVIRSGTYSVGDAAGQNWRLETFLKTTAGSWTYKLAVRWFNASSSLISTTEGTPTALPGGSWYLLSVDFTAPAGAVTAQVEITLTAGASSSALYMDRPALWQTLPLIAAEDVDDQAVVQVVLRELEVGQLLTVWRIHPDGSRHYVRGPDGLYDGTFVVPGDSMLIEDYEAPLGVEVYYRTVTVWSDGTGVENRTSLPVTVDAPDVNYVWLTDPHRPGIGLRVMVKQAPEWKQGIEQTVYKIRGRSAPVVLSDVRGSREGDLVCWTQTDEEREQLRFMLSTGNVLLWRCAPGTGEPDVYVSVGEVGLPRIVPLASEQWREWTLPLTEVDMPTGAQAGSATWTVHDVVVENDTGYTVLDRYATVFDLATNRRRA
jgi:hypothetical protein